MPYCSGDNQRASRMLITKLDPAKTPWSSSANPPFIAHGISFCRIRPGSNDKILPKENGPGAFPLAPAMELSSTVGSSSLNPATESSFFYWEVSCELNLGSCSCIVQTGLQLVGDESNLRFEKNIFVIASDVIDLQAVTRTFAPPRSRVLHLTKRLVI